MRKKKTTKQMIVNAHLNCYYKSRWLIGRICLLSTLYCCRKLVQMEFFRNVCLYYIWAISLRLLLERWIFLVSYGNQNIVANVCVLEINDRGQYDYSESNLRWRQWNQWTSWNLWMNILKSWNIRRVFFFFLNNFLIRTKNESMTQLK